MTDGSQLLSEQAAYYRARAPEYDDWFFRHGRYDRGREANARWLHEVALVEQALAGFAPLGRVADLAAGTGLWTRWLAPLSAGVTAVDASEEMLELNRSRVRAANVDHVCADIFKWRPTRQFDDVFMGFWLSHVPPERFDGFWRLVERLVGHDGRFFLVDSLYNPVSTAADHRLEDSDDVIVTRRLADGREYRIVKVFHDPDELGRRLTERGWRVELRTSGEFFLYGHGSRPGPPARSPAHP